METSLNNPAKRGCAMIRYTGIHHVSLNVTDLAKAEAFYEGVLGLRKIERPPFDFAGAWYGVGDSGQQLHLIVKQPMHAATGEIVTRDGHFAMRVADWTAALEWLQRCGIEHRANAASITGFAQIFLHDPDLNLIELNAVIDMP
jgi:glyoxylase I family protein